VSSAEIGCGPAQLHAEVAEAIRRLTAVHAQANDDGRVEDLVACYCPHAVVEVVGVGIYQGHTALRALFESVRPTAPQRHLVFNTVVTEWTDSAARSTSDVIFIALGERGWQIEFVGKHDDSFHCEGGVWRICRRTTSFTT
jgi:hypothetical protein